MMCSKLFEVEQIGDKYFGKLSRQKPLKKASESKLLKQYFIVVYKERQQVQANFLSMIYKTPASLPLIYFFHMLLALMRCHL